MYAEKYSVYSCLFYMILFAFYRNKFYHPVVLINHVVMMNGVCFLNYMQYMDQQQPCKSVVSNNGNQIVDSCDQRTGSNCRIDFDLVKEHRDQCADMLEITMATIRENPTQPEIRNACPIG